MTLVCASKLYINCHETSLVIIILTGGLNNNKLRDVNKGQQVIITTACDVPIYEMKQIAFFFPF